MEQGPKGQVALATGASRGAGHRGLQPPPFVMADEYLKD